MFFRRKPPIKPVSERRKLQAFAENLTYDQFAYIAQRVPIFYLVRFLADGGMTRMGPDSVKDCRRLAREADRYADLLQSEIDDHGYGLQAADVERIKGGLYRDAS